MIKTQKIFDKTIQEIAEVVKLLNEEGEDEDSKIISDMNDDISDLHSTLLDGSNDFLELKDLENYIEDVVGKNYFSDRRCWDYLYDSVFEVFMDIPTVFDESMQTGLGMAQQLPTNSVYDGELDDLYNGENKKMKKLINGLAVDDACDMALESNFDVDDDKKADENITKINKVSDAWETYKKSWKKFNKEYLEKDFFETIAYLKKNGLFNKKANDVIDGWMDDIEQIFYSDTEPNKMELNFGFSGNDIFESKEKNKMKRLEEKRIDEEDRIEALAQFLGLDEEEKEDIEVDDETLTYDGEEYLVVTEDEGYEMAKEDVQSFLEYDMGLEGVSESTQEYALENFCTYDWESNLHSYNESYCDDIKSEYDNEYGSRLVQECDDRVGLDDEDGGFIIKTENEDGEEMFIYDNKGNMGGDINKAVRFLTEFNAQDYIDNYRITDSIKDTWEIEFEEDLVDFDDLSEKLTEELDKDFDSMSEWFEDIYGRGWAKEMKDTLKDYIDWEALAEYVVDSDGVANTLARYDGKSNEEKVNGEWLYIYRTN